MNNFSDRKTIYVVDDEEINLDLLDGILEDNYQVECFGGGQAFLEKFSQSPSDVVLLDVEMPGLNGLEVCQQLLEIKPKTPVIFVSMKASNEERLAGYVAGGFDYIVKPCDPQELLAKIALITQQMDSQRQLEADRKDITDAFMETLSDRGELGVVLEFSIKAFEAKSYQQLADFVTQALTELAYLKCAVLVNGNQGSLCWTSEGFCSPMESEILSLLKEKGRIYNFNNRVQVNEEFISVLIKNMPSDEKIYGRVIDHIPRLLRIASACIENIDTSHNLSASRETLSTLQAVSNQLMDAEAVLMNSVSGFMRSTETEILRIKHSIQYLALSEEQENKLLEGLSIVLDQALKSSDEIADICDKFDALVHRLKDMLPRH